MQFKFLCAIDTEQGRIPPETIRELTEATAIRYAGRKFDHLEPMDREAKALLDSLKAPKAKPELKLESKPPVKKGK